MNPMIYIRKLLDGQVGYDLTDPFKNAFMKCPDCGDVMLLDRTTWSSKCFKCSFAEADIPDMVMSRTGLSREDSCISYGIFLETGCFSLDPEYPSDGVEIIASGLKGSMRETRDANKKLLNNPFLLEALKLKVNIRELEVIERYIGISILSDYGFFLLPKIEMLSLVASVNIISMHNPSITTLECMVATPQE